MKNADPLAYKLWSRAIRAEINNLVTHGTFSLEEANKDEFVIPTTLVFKVKLTSDGSWDKAKARICVRGDIQGKHEDEDTWSPTSTKRTLRTLLADAAKHGAKIRQLDYIGAFLQAPVRGRIFVTLPSEFSEIHPKYNQYYGRPLRLIKSAYGMILSSKNWFLELQGFLVSEKVKFIRSDLDNALFVRKEHDGSITKMLVYIDDSLYYNTRNNEQILRALENDLKARFKIELQGFAHWFLSMRISQDRFGNYTLDQSRYIKNIVNKYIGGTKKRNITRPLSADWIATKDDCAKNEKEIVQLTEEYRMEYQSVIGSLIYLMNTRPDITFAVTKLAKFMRSPGRPHFKALIHLLGYLRDNAEYGLKYYRKIEDSAVHELLCQNDITDKHNMFGMCDSSWQDCVDTGRSTGSYMIFYQGGLVDFSTFVPVPVAMSTAEAECNAGASAGMAISHMRMLINEVNGSDADIIWNPSILLLTDSKSAETIVNSEKDVKSLRHCKRRLFYLRQLKREQEIKFEYLSNNYMLADGGTKNLDGAEVDEIRKVIMVKVSV